MKKQNFDLYGKDKQDWKNKNPKYLLEIQKFLDKVDNIEDIKLKESILYQMLRCDRVLTEISEEMFEKYYEKGKKEAN